MHPYNHKYLKFQTRPFYFYKYNKILVFDIYFIIITFINIAFSKKKKKTYLDIAINKKKRKKIVNFRREILK